MLIPSNKLNGTHNKSSLSRRVNANSQRWQQKDLLFLKLIKKGEC